MKKHSPPYLNPLPILKPQNPPTKVLNLCKQQAQVQTLNLPAVPQVEDESLYYHTFQKEKCLQCEVLIDKLRVSEQTVNKLLEANQKLQKKVLMLQDERWKKYDYSAITSVRLRSKSTKPHKKIPTIEVKVPNQLKENQILIQDEQQEKTDRNKQNEQISFFMQQIQKYNEQIKQLRTQNQNLKQQLTKYSENQIKNNSQLFRERPSMSLQNRLPIQNHSLLTEYRYERDDKIKTPYITDFSPLPKNSSEEIAQTVKKDFLSEPVNGLQIQIKRLKNQVLYKDLLLDKIRVENIKQKGVLQRHLYLSVEESKKIAEETTLVMNEFKSELIKLAKELEASKTKCTKLEIQLNRYRCEQEHLNIDDHTHNKASSGTRQLLQILKTRRSEHLAG